MWPPHISQGARKTLNSYFIGGIRQSDLGQGMCSGDWCSGMKTTRYSTRDCLTTLPVGSFHFPVSEAGWGNNDDDRQHSLIALHLTPSSQSLSQCSASLQCCTWRLIIKYQPRQDSLTYYCCFLPSNDGFVHGEFIIGAHSRQRVRMNERSTACSADWYQKEDQEWRKVSDRGREKGCSEWISRQASR